MTNEDISANVLKVLNEITPELLEYNYDLVVSHPIIRVVIEVYDEDNLMEDPIVGEDFWRGILKIVV